MGTVLLEKMRQKWFRSHLFNFFTQEVGVLLRHGDSVVAQFADTSREMEQSQGHFWS